MKFYIITGEASGDMHGANLIKALKEQDPDADFRCWGGDRMEAEGASLAMHYRDLAFMGFKEVIANLDKIIANFRFCKKDIKEYDPDAVILMDYPGFNLRMAKHLKREGYKVIYYISPQVWAWKASRVKKIKKYVDQMLVILPFEKEFYHRWNYDVTFVGHPLLDITENFKPDLDFKKRHQLPDKPLIAILPGSRKQEISKMLHPMLDLIPDFPDYHFVIAGAPGIDKSFYEQWLSGLNASVVYDETYNLMSWAESGLVTSGTATLEAALFELPEIVCYKGSKFSFWIAKQLVNVSYISLVNLVMQKEVVKELIQDDFNISNLRKELNNLLNNDDYREKIVKNYKQLKETLGKEGASERAAREIIKCLV